MSPARQANRSPRRSKTARQTQTQTGPTPQRERKARCFKKDLLPLLEQITKSGKPLLIIVRDLRTRRWLCCS
jgi:hypothetical protein